MARDRSSDGSAAASGARRDPHHPYLGRCSTCGSPLDGQVCPQCFHMPLNISPRRVGHCGHQVETSGWCPYCVSFTATRLVPSGSAWKETKQTSVLLSPEENRRRLSALTELLEGRSVVAEGGFFPQQRLLDREETGRSDDGG